MPGLALHWDGQRVGRIVEFRRAGGCIFGRFVPESGFEVCRAAFEAAYHADDEYVRAGGDPAGADRSAWHAIVETISPHVSLPDVSELVEEFNVFADNEVEIYLSE